MEDLSPIRGPSERCRNGRSRQIWRVQARAPDSDCNSGKIGCVAIWLQMLHGKQTALRQTMLPPSGAPSSHTTKSRAF